MGDLVFHSNFPNPEYLIGSLEGSRDVLIFKDEGRRATDYHC